MTAFIQHEQRYRDLSGVADKLITLVAVMFTIVRSIVEGERADNIEQNVATTSSEHVSYIRGVDMTDIPIRAVDGVAKKPQPATMSSLDPSIFQLAHKILGMHVLLYTHLDGNDLRIQDVFTSPTVKGTVPIAPGMVIPIEQSFCQFVCRSARPLVIADATAIAPFNALSAYRDYGFISYVGVPLIRQNGAILGTLSGLSFLPITVDVQQIGMLQLVADALMAHLERITMVQQLERQRLEGLLARRDALTGLPNRRAFDDALDAGVARAGAASHLLSLIFIDIDHFKSFNDRFGHDVGDMVLRLVTKRITQALGDNGMAFRLGGEELVILLPDTDTKAALLIAERLRRAVRAEITTMDLTHDSVSFALLAELRITASFGVATYPTGAANAHGLLKRADAAMYHAKHAGRDRVSAAGESTILTQADPSARDSDDVAA